MRVFSCVVFTFLLVAAPAAAQTHDHDHQHGSIDRLGKVSFPTSCSERVQETFNRGVALLHSFWFDEAERTFLKVAEADPGCGMAWWGVAMSNYHAIWAPPSADEMQRGRTAAEKARSLGAKTERERAYIDAINRFYADSATVDHPTRARNYGDAMEQVAAKFADDDEAKVFYGLTLIARGMANANDKTYAHQKRAAEVLNRLLPRHPEHPGIAHYIIHSFDYPALAHLAVDAAHAYAKIAPDSAHALHMPSHIFVRLGMWPETIASNLESARSGHATVRRNNPEATSWDALHAYDYLAYAYLQRGQDDKVRALLEELPRVKKLDIDNFAGYYALSALPARYALERRNWSEAAALAVNSDLPSWSKYSYAEALTSFARAIGAAKTGQLTRARSDLEKLRQIHAGLAAQKNNYWAEQVQIQSTAAEATIARAEGRNDEAVALMTRAADAEDATEKHPVTPGSVIPARELLGELLLELDRPGDALAAFERSLKENPNRLNGLTGAARAAQLSGNREKARGYYLQAAKLLEGDGAQVAAR